MDDPVGVPSDPLVAFLKACLDEDEQVARDAHGATWGVGRTERVEWGPLEPGSDGVAVDEQGQRWPQAWTDTASYIYSS